MHHQYFKDNYGLYFTWRDKIMKTHTKKTMTVLNKVSDETMQLRKSAKQHAL